MGDGKRGLRKTFDVLALEWLAALCSQIPYRGEKMVIYCGFFNTGRDYSSTRNHQVNAQPKVAELCGLKVRLVSFYTDLARSASNTE